MALNPTKTAANDRVALLIKGETEGRLKPEHQQELNTLRAQGLAPALSSGTQDQSQAAGLAVRVAGSANDIANITATNPDAARPELDTAVLGGVLGRGFTNSSPRNRVEDAQRDVLDAALTLGTGAAYTKEQLEGYRESLFPQYWDDDNAVADKSRRLARILEAAKLRAGPNAQMIDRAIQLTQSGLKRPADPAAIAQSEADKREGLTRLNTATAQDASGRLVVDVEGGQLAPEQQAEIAARTKDTDSIGAAALGLADTVTFGGLDEIGSAAEAAFGSGSGSFSDRYGARLAVNRGIIDRTKETNGGAYLTGQIGGGLVLPTFGATGIGQLARLGAGYGAAYGFGSSNGDVGDRAVNAGIGGAAGGIGAAALAGLGGAVASRFGGTPPGGGAGRELLEAGARQGVDVLPADIGGAMTRRFTAGAVQTPFGSGPIVRAADRAQTQAGARLGEIATTEGGALRQEALGEVGQRAAQGYIDRTGNASREAYAAARGMASGEQLQGVNAVSNIDQQLAELAPTANTDAPLISGLQRLRADLANEGDLNNLSIDAIRRLRTSTRAEATTEGLRGTDYQRRAGQVLDALSEDIASQLNPRAAAAFREADRAYAERLSTIDDVMEQVVGANGDRSAEAVANRLGSLARGDSARLGRFLNAVTPEEAGIVRGSLINQIGRANSGAQNAAGDAFSFSTFLSNWDKLPERSRNLLFRGEHRQAVEDLAQLAQGARATRTYANTSGTGGAMNSSRFVSEAGRLASTGGALSTLGLTPVLENLTGRLLASQRFTQFLARPPRDRGAAIRRLGAIASREPAIANDIAPIQQAMQAASPRAAAENQKQDNRQ